MVKITFVDNSGASQIVDAQPGVSLMRAAVDNGVNGISADCGGACACATCQVYVADEWFAKTGAPAEDEQAMLGFTNSVRGNSRLSCQITLTAALDGMVVTTPEQQT
ncbi:(2Fe-2S) ferredoxin [Acidocella aquatica]|uniref:(2Fe-2S) ferredoxin n=1 Tax=Acidocella aquatica TaxID=1922313 RepID=A0ABQ6A7R9_9PROT|nr:2Fe-2S iron-sulfur cluster-binding protein [Acidocella aquatica]GLR66110.1 (2Fe-2S) ferredoxin [Acidocella aquatica]